MRISPLRSYVMVLAGDDPRGIPITDGERDKAVEHLKQIAGKDFGHDAQRWGNWLQKNMPDKYY